MSVKQQIDADIKTAMLAGDKVLVTTLRGLKSAILNVEVAEGKREEGLSDDVVINLLQKEAKKRQESADLYAQGGSPERQQAELTEKTVIEKYLPQQLSEAEISILVDEVIASTGASGMQAMGQVIGGVKAKAGAAADGAVIARIVKEKLGA
jgi:uncharacterized protein YqeY